MVASLEEIVSPKNVIDESAAFQVPPVSVPADKLVAALSDQISHQNRLT